MGSYGGYYKGDKRKVKKEVFEKKTAKIIRIQTVPKVEILGKKGK